VFIYQVPLNHLNGIASNIQREFAIPVIYWDGDMPSSLPEYADGKSFRFSMYPGANINEYALYLTNSKGCIGKLHELGARKVDTLYYAADPDIFSRIDIDKSIDVFYYGHRNIGKEKQFDYMITEPSRLMPDKKFCIGGQDSVHHNTVNFDGALIPKLTLSQWRTVCNQSKINLNITKETDSFIYASSSARPFELAAMGCCIVSDMYSGITEWFTGSDLIVVDSLEKAIDTYSYLLTNKYEQVKMGISARNRILIQHTYRHRAEQLINMIRSL
jgi:spore maturation protein CgeB